MTQPKYEPRWSTHGMPGIVVGESHSLSGHLIDMRCLDHLLAVTSQIAVAHVIGKDDQNIGRLLRGYIGGIGNRDDGFRIFKPGIQESGKACHRIGMALTQVGGLPDIRSQVIELMAV